MQEPVELLIAERNDREAELAEHDGALEDAGVADLGERLFALQALAGFEANDRSLRIGRVSGD